MDTISGRNASKDLALLSEQEENREEALKAFKLDGYITETDDDADVDYPILDEFYNRAGRRNSPNVQLLNGGIWPTLFPDSIRHRFQVVIWKGLQVWFQQRGCFINEIGYFQACRRLVILDKNVYSDWNDIRTHYLRVYWYNRRYFVWIRHNRVGEAVQHESIDIRITTISVWQVGSLRYRCYLSTGKLPGSKSRRIKKVFHQKEYYLRL